MTGPTHHFHSPRNDTKTWSFLRLHRRGNVNTSFPFKRKFTSRALAVHEGSKTPSDKHHRPIQSASGSASPVSTDAVSIALTSSSR
jgi:hypothetical protein